MMKLKIVTPERMVLEEDVDAVYGKTTDGQVGILPKHVPLITPLEIGILSYQKNGQKHPVAAMGGILSTDGKSVTILTDAAELSSEVDAARAQQALERAQARLKEISEDVDQARAQKALARAQTRLTLTR